MTLDDFGFRFFSSRVISVLSYYLTSLVTSVSTGWTNTLLDLDFTAFRFVSYLLSLAFPLHPHIRMNTFAVSFRLLRIRSIAFCCFQIDPSDFLLACVISFWSIWFFAFSFFSDLLLLFLDFAVVFLLRLASWFCQVPFLQLLFWSFRFCPFDSVFTNFPVPYSFFDSSACFRYCPFHSETSSKM